MKNISENIEKVKDQYESMPYPYRDPEEEMTRLIKTTGDHLFELNHFCFGGRRDFTKNFRVLVAGGGTGDALIYLGEQLKNTSAEIVYIDLSENSMNIAQARAKKREINNIVWINDSITNLSCLGLGKFDYVSCGGMLHHLPDPNEGLQELKNALKEDGALFIMVYATLGRYAVYLMQSLLKDIVKPEWAFKKKLSVTRSVIDELPECNYFKKEFPMWSQEYIHDGDGGDSGLYDLLLHHIDHSYSIESLYDFIEGQELKILNFVGVDRLKYDPDYFSSDEELRALWKDKSIKERQAVAEKIYSAHIKHSFYAAFTENRMAKFDDDLCIKLVRELEGQNEAISKALLSQRKLVINSNESDRVVELPGGALSSIGFEQFDGKTSIKSIIETTRSKSGNLDSNEIKNNLNALFNSLHEVGWAYLQKNNG